MFFKFYEHINTTYKHLYLSTTQSSTLHTSNKVLHGPMAAVAYLIDYAASRTIALPKGHMSCSSAITVIHITKAGATSLVNFKSVGNIKMKLVLTIA